MKIDKNIIIIGAGLSGIYLAYQLKKEGFSVKVLEANDRIGGRIYTKNSRNSKVEMGATWLWKYNSELLKVCKTLGISIFEQNMEGDALYEANPFYTPQRFQIPKNQEISYRIVGGTISILEKLKAHLSIDTIHLNQKVIKIKSKSDSIEVFTQNSTYNTDFVISTIPPHLLINTVDFYPKLDNNLIQVANNTHTWMKDSIKFAVVYEKPFWRDQKLSGTGFSNSGPFTEVYDHSDFENNHFALMGFLNAALFDKTKAEREEKVQQQLYKFFGDNGKQYLTYVEKVWQRETLTNYNNNSYILPHNNNGHSVYKQIFLNEKLFIAGSETSSRYGGYMEGAICRGNEITEQLKNKFTLV